MNVIQPKNFNECLEQLEKEKGFTYSLFGLNPSSGFLVSLEGFEVKTSFDDSKEVFKNFIFQNVLKTVENQNLFFGGWIHQNEVYFDLSKHFNSLKEAICFGIANKQLAIFDIEKGEVVKLPKPQISGTEYQKNAYISQWISNFIEKY